MAASLYQARAIRAMFWGDVGAFLAFMTAAAEAFERAGDLRSAGTQRANQAYAYIELGAYAAAEQWLRQVLATAERMGLRDLAAGARNNLGIALGRNGALDEARAVETAAVRASVSRRGTAASRAKPAAPTWPSPPCWPPATCPAPSARRAPPSTSSPCTRPCAPTPWGRWRTGAHAPPGSARGGAASPPRRR